MLRRRDEPHHDRCCTRDLGSHLGGELARLLRLELDCDFVFLTAGFLRRMLTIASRMSHDPLLLHVLHRAALPDARTSHTTAYNTVMNAGAGTIQAVFIDTVHPTHVTCPAPGTLVPTVAALSP